MAIGIGAVLVSVTTAANAGVADGQGRARRRPAECLPAAGHRPRPGDLLRHRHRAHQRAAHRARPADAALTAGFHSALLACAVFLLAAAVIALRATNSRGEPAIHPAAPMPPASRFPRRNWPTDHEMVKARLAASQPAHKRSALAA